MSGPEQEPNAQPPPAFDFGHGATEGPPEPLAKIPYPPFVLVLAVVTALAFVFALFRAPAVFSAAINHERGQVLLSEGKSKEAIDSLSVASKSYPDSLKVSMDLIEALVRAKRYPEAVKEIDRWNGKDIPEEDYARIDRLVQEVVKNYPEVMKK